MMEIVSLRRWKKHALTLYLWKELPNDIHYGRFEGLEDRELS